MSNFKKHCIFTILYNLGLSFCSGAIVQTFLLQKGLSESQVYLYNSLILFAQVAMMFLLTFLAGRLRRIKIIIGIAYFTISALALFLLFSLLQSVDFGKSQVSVLFIIAVLSYFGVGVSTILSYTLPYKIIDMKDYGKLTGLEAALAGGVTFLVSLLYSFLLSKFNYMKTTACFFTLAIICFVATGIICLSLKEATQEYQAQESTKTDLIAVFKNKNTYLLLLPNFARGLAMGVFNVIAVFAISLHLLNETTASYVTIIIQIATFIANLFFAFAYKRFSSTNLLLFATIGTCVFLPLSLEFGTVGFFLIFTMACFFRLIVDTAIPVVITEIIPQNQIGGYTSIRMLIFTGAQAVATLILTPIIQNFGYTTLLIFAAILQLFCGIPYYIVAKMMQNKQKLQDSVE